MKKKTDSKYENLFRKNLEDNRCLLILQLNLFRSEARQKHSAAKELYSIFVQGKEL